MKKKYTYTITNDFTTGYEWICFYRNYSNVFFRFKFDNYKESIKSIWLSPEQAYDYLRDHYLRDHQFLGYDLMITKRTSI